MDQMTTPKIAFDNSYARLPERFFTLQAPTPVLEPKMIRLNQGLAKALGIDPAALDAEALSGNRTPEGATPLAQVYAGHQFGGWSAQLGDGRAILLGEVVTPEGARRDIQLKGSGRTPYSRMGDGRAPLGPVIREYVVSEAMAALGVPTTRALAAVETGEPVLREDGPLPGGILTRVAASHIRVGTFQFFGARDDQEAIRLLVDHALERHYPEASRENPARALLENVIAAQARLIAKWMSLGFIHGVMNTDNMTISGETIDYGPCAFLDGFDTQKKFSFIDEGGRYAYHMQPGIAHWNLARLAISLVPALAEQEEEAIEIAKGLLEGYGALFEAEWLRLMALKLGLKTPDQGLIEAWLSVMEGEQADFTLAHRYLADAAEGNEAPLRGLFSTTGPLDAWLKAWGAQIEPGAETAKSLRAVNPLYIPRNHLVQEAIAAAYNRDFGPFGALVDVLADPFTEQEGKARYASPPQPEEIVQRTFCGT